MKSSFFSLVSIDMAYRKDPIEDHYIIGTSLGSGSFGDVKICTEKATGKDWAVKIITKKGNSVDEKRMEIIQVEIDILKVVNHDNVVKLKDIFETDTHFYIIMEVISGGELFDKIVELTHYSEKEAARLTAQILRGIAHLHEKRIIHRDLKPENLLLSSKSLDAVIKITDFGLSKIFQEDEQELGYNAVGTPGYIAPEVLNLLDTGEPYSREIDLWAVGVILYILLCGFPPFHGEDEEEVYDKITAGDWVFLSPYWDPVSKEAKDLIEKLLNLDPRARLTASQALAHPWIAHYETNSEAHLNEAIVQLKKFNAKRKFRGAILAVKALAKLRRFK